MRLALLFWALGLSYVSGEAPRILNVCLDVHDPSSLDPHKQFAEKSHTVCQQIFDALVRFDPQGKIEPALAESWERVGPLRMRFFLRRGVRFHNGEPFDAESVRFSIERYLDPKTRFPAAGFLGTIEKVEAIDPHTVEIVTRMPDGLLLNRLAGFVLIVPPGYLREVGEERFAREPVGTGAFRFRSWLRGERIELEANKDYWMRGYPRVDGLVFRVIPRKEQIPELFAGRVDVVVDVPGTQTLKIQKNPGTRVVKGSTFYTVAPVLRFTKGPLADRRVRQALNHATNLHNLVRYDLLGNGLPIASLSMPGEEGHDPGLVPYAYDPRKAARLLAEAGYPRGLTLRAMVRENTERTARIMAADWKQIGVKLEIDLMTEAEELERFKDPKYDLGIGGAPDPMCHAFFIPAITIYSRSPYSLGRDPQFDSMLETMAATIDDKERVRLAKALDRYIHSEALSIFTYQRLQIYGIRSGVSFPHYISGMPYFFAATKR